MIFEHPLSSVSDFLNLPDLTQIQIIACVLKSVPNPKLEKISKIQSKSNPNPNPNNFKFEKIRSKSDPNPIQIQSNSQSIVPLDFLSWIKSCRISVSAESADDKKGKY
ncbi:hypothetical protein OUZ56_032108 [Daphnia magna]|uniref:Uncharacterized protein n=1 Tax=Daphnia magna TaxID=35525 RepID=A0ABQ9ZW84_9CRUS|nr:hypothetical protein OUZ56_032108 [Daphnia magna]